MKVKILTIALILLLANVRLYGQKISNVRFVHGGEENKPVGTISISVDSLIAPKDNPADDLFGKAVKTDNKSFNLVIEFINKCRYLTGNPLDLYKSSQFFKIKIVSATGIKELYFGGKHYFSFFEDLAKLLIKKSADPNLIKVLK